MEQKEGGGATSAFSVIGLRHRNVAALISKLHAWLRAE